MVTSAFLMTPWWLLSGSAPRPHLQLQAWVISSQSRKIWKSLSGYHLGGYHLVPTVSWATSPSVPLSGRWPYTSFPSSERCHAKESTGPALPSQL